MRRETAVNPREFADVRRDFFGGLRREFARVRGLMGDVQPSHSLPRELLQYMNI